MPPAAAAPNAAARGSPAAATAAASTAAAASAEAAAGDATAVAPRRRRRTAMQREGDNMTTMTVVLVGAITLAVGASLVEAGLRAWRGSARRKRRERKARGSRDNLEATPPPSPPPLTVNTRAHQARARLSRLRRVDFGAHRRKAARNAAVLSALKPSLADLCWGLTGRAPPAQPRGLPEGEYYRSPRRSRDGSYAPVSPRMDQRGFRRR